MSCLRSMIAVMLQMLFIDSLRVVVARILQGRPGMACLDWSASGHGYGGYFSGRQLQQPSFALAMSSSAETCLPI